MTNNKNGQSPIHRTWFITGASSGIGLASTSAALERGDTVVATSRTIDGLAELVAAYPDTLRVITTDVRDEDAVKQAVDRTVADFGRIDVVANYAGIGLFGGVEEITGAQWQAIFDTNFFGTMNVLRAVLPVLRAQRSGHVLIGSAQYGQGTHTGVGSVAATKHALEAVTDALAEEVAPLGITVTAVEPGFTATAFIPRIAMGANLISDYDPTVRATLAAVGQLPPEAFSSADAVAAAVLAAVDAPHPPRRLATGSGSFTIIKDSLEMRLKNLHDWADVTHGVDSFATQPA